MNIPIRKALALLFFLLSAPTPSPGVEKGLIAHWTFNEGSGPAARDATGRGHDALLQNLEWVPSPRGFALRFDSKEDLAVFSEVGSMNLEGDLTLAVWVKTDSAVGKDTHRLIFGDCGLAVERNLNLQLDGSNGLRFEWANGKAAASLVGPGPLLNGSWKHVAVTASAKEKLAVLYVDSEEVARLVMPFPISKTPVRERRTGWFYNGFFQGELDDIRVYNRKLSPDEIRRLFEAEADVQVGPATAKLQAGLPEPKGVSSVSIQNRSRESRLVKISCGEFTLPPGHAAEVVLGEVPLRPVWSNRQDLFVCRQVPETGKPLLEIHRGQSIDSMSPGLSSQRILEPIRVELSDPWQAQMTGGQTERIQAILHLAVSDQLLSQVKLQIRLISRETGAELLSREIPHPGTNPSLDLDVRTLPWGACDLEVSLQDDSGGCVGSVKRLATILPGGSQQVHPLNNLVSELADARARGLLEKPEIDFMNPRDGWVWFRASGSCEVALGDSKVLTSKQDAPAAEAMRLLPAGRHVLRVSGKPAELLVRAVPALVYNVYPSTPMIAPFGGHTWERLSKHMLPNCNMIEAQVVDTPEHRQWLNQGKLWLTNVQAPGLLDTKDWTADKMLDIWLHPGKSTAHAERPGLLLEKVSGVQVDEYYPSAKSTRSALLDATAASLAQLSESPGFSRKLFIPFFAHFYGATNPLFLKTILGSGWPFSEEVYVGEMPTEEQNRANIRSIFLNVAHAYETAQPGSLRHMIFTPMYANLPYCTANRYPQADFRVHLDMQMQMLATEPAFFGLWGIQPYRSNYVDEEMLNCMAKMLRHYCIEGRTERMLAEPYELKHVTDPDFTEGTKDWEIAPAGEGSITSGRFAGYGQLQGRYPAGDFGNTFLVLKRSAKSPNLVSQEMRNLTPGRTYSLKLITGDHADLLAGISRKETQSLSIQIDGAEILPGGFRYPFPSARGPKPFEKGKQFWMTYHWLQFCAKAPVARLRLSDWASPVAPREPAGQEILCSFVEVQPAL